MVTRLVLIAHASTAATRSAAFPRDEPLDDRGRASVSRTALPTTVTSWPARCGPALRCHQTAELLGLRATPEPALGDWYMGAWAGLTLDQVQAQHPAEVRQWLADPDCAHHGGETLTELLARVATWLTGLQMPRLVVVTHPSVVRAALVHVLSSPPRSFWRIDVPPMGRVRISGRAGAWNVALAG